MIRFRTIDPAKDDKPAPKPTETPAAQPAVVEVGDHPAEGSAPAPKSKGMARKTPLRAKKPDAARLFRD